MQHFSTNIVDEVCRTKLKWIFLMQVAQINSQFFLQVLVDNQKCKHLSHAPGLVGQMAPLADRKPFCHAAYLPIQMGNGQNLSSRTYSGVRFEDFMFANDLQVHT